MATTILRLPDVKKRTGLSRSAIYLLVKNGEFPAPVRLGARTVGWLDGEVTDWLEERIKKSRRTAAAQARNGGADNAG